MTVTSSRKSLLRSCDVCPVLALTSDPVRKWPGHSSLTHDPRKDLTQGSSGISAHDLLRSHSPEARCLLLCDKLDRTG